MCVCVIPRPSRANTCDHTPTVSTNRAPLIQVGRLAEATELINKLPVSTKVDPVWTSIVRKYAVASGDPAIDRGRNQSNPSGSGDREMMRISKNTPLCMRAIVIKKNTHDCMVQKVETANRRAKEREALEREF